MSEKKNLPRSEEVRQRRKRAEERALVTHSMDRRTRRTPPPSVTRNVSVDAATVRSTSRPVRQYQAVIAAPAAGRLHAPAMPRIRVGWRLLSFFLVTLLGAGLYYAYTLPMFHINSVTLLGNQYLSAEETGAALRLNGMPIFLLEPKNVEKALRLNFPEIASVDVTVELPNRVLIALTERQPVLRWEQGNAFTWLDAQGVALRPRAEVGGLVAVRALGAPPSGPLSALDPLSPIPFADARIVETARVLAPYAPQGATLLYDPKYGIGWNDARGWTVWFGASPDQADMKLRVYVVLADSLTQRGITPIMINVAYPNAPYYRLGQ
ncbi:MAG: Cell division protein FtsQ [Anaerolineales bacterium]|nr:Cell division protein FtsQ [Anaerolineales bacterium]